MDVLVSLSYRTSLTGPRECNKKMHEVGLDTPDSVDTKMSKNVRSFVSTESEEVQPDVQTKHRRLLENHNRRPTAIG